MSLFNLFLSYFNPWMKSSTDEEIITQSKKSKSKKTKKTKKDPLSDPSIDVYDYSTKKMPTFPKKIVLLITTHGCVPLKRGKLSTFLVPNNMKIIKCSASTLGEVNFVNKKQLSKQVDIIKSHLDELLQSNANESYVEVFEKINNTMRKLDHELYTSQIEKELTRKQLPEIDYGYYYQKKNDLDYNINIFNTGDEMIDKIFTRSATEVTNYDMRINILNMKGNPDIMKWFYRRLTRRRLLNEFTLSEIIDFLQIFGVNEIVIIDLSCSEFSDVSIPYLDIPIPGRHKRSLRREQLSQETPTKKTRLSITSKYKNYGGKHKSQKRNILY